MILEKNDNPNIFRSFICIDFPNEIIKEIARIQELLEKKFVGKFTELENLHLTLKFLGEINNETIEKVNIILSKLEFNIFDCRLEDIGTFTFKGFPKIIWIKIAGKPIYDLQMKIDEALSEMFPKEERFMSHLTIARIKYITDKENFMKSIKNITVKKINFKVESFKLMSSDLKPLGPVYSLTKEYKLKSISSASIEK